MPPTSEARDAAILIVDDEPCICHLVSRWLSDEGYASKVASNSRQAWELLQEDEFALLICDIRMPETSGMDLLARVKEHFADRVAVIMVTGLDDRQTAIRALQLGAYGYVVKPFEKNEVMISVINALDRRRMTLEIRCNERRLEQEVLRRTAQVCDREAEIILRLISASEYRDDETGAHIRRIGLYAAALAEVAGWDREKISDLRLAGAMHDIGKIGVPDNILLKPGKLTGEEFDVVKNHTQIGARILGGSKIPLLVVAAEIARSHHEKWDGSGYPDGLSGEDIPASARIVAVADVYDALISHRVYRPALPEREAVEIMTEQKGKHFDPFLFECFLSVLPEFHRIRGIIDYVELETADKGERTKGEEAAPAYQPGRRALLMRQ